MIRVDSAATLAALRSLEADLLAAAKQAFGQSVSYAAEVARQTTAFKDSTPVASKARGRELPPGSARDSIRRIDRGPWAAEVSAGGNKAPHVLFLEEGTKPHTITPKKAGGVLAFQAAGDMVFARSVKHPGTKPTHFMLDARDRAEVVLARFIEAGFRSAIGE